MASERDWGPISVTLSMRTAIAPVCSVIALQLRWLRSTVSPDALAEMTARSDPSPSSLQLVTRRVVELTEAGVAF